MAKRIRIYSTVLAVLAGSASLLGFLGSSWWRFDQMAHFRVQYVVILLLSAICLLLVRSWRIATATIIFIAVNAVVIAPAFIPDGSARSGASQLTLLQFNVLTSNQQRHRAAAFIHDSNADVVSLQEVDEEWMKVLRALEGYRVVFEDPHDDDNFGIAMLIATNADAALRPRLESFSPVSRAAGVPAIEVTLDFAGRELRVLSLHTLPPSNARQSALRDAALNAAADWAREGSSIIIGDLNATPWSASYAPLRRAGLRDSGRGFGLQPTWPAFHPPILGLTRIPIDHCLVTSDLVAVDREVGPRLGSDHVPLKISVDWAK